MNSTSLNSKLQTTNKYDDEKDELFKIIRQLESKIENSISKSPRKKNLQANELIKFISQVKGEETKKVENIERRLSSVASNLERDKDWPLKSQDIIDELRKCNLELEKEMLNFKYLYNVRENDFKRVHDQYTNSLNDITFLKESRLSF